MHALLHEDLKELAKTLNHVNAWAPVTNDDVTIYVPDKWLDKIIIGSIKVADKECAMGMSLIEFSLDMGRFLINTRLLTNAASCSKAAGYDGINLATGLIALEFKYKGFWYNAFDCEHLSTSDPKALHFMINALFNLHESLIAQP